MLPDALSLSLVFQVVFYISYMYVVTIGSVSATRTIASQLILRPAVPSAGHEISQPFGAFFLRFLPFNVPIPARVVLLRPASADLPLYHAFN